MKKVIDHFILDEKYPFGDDVRVYSCAFEDGERVTTKNVYNIGNGSVCFIACVACNSEIESSVLSSILVEAGKRHLYEIRK